MGKFKGLNVICAAFFVILLSFSSAYARPGCCSKHKGVAGCNTSTGYLQCKDGTTSPSCTCNNTVVPSKSKSTQTYTPVPTTTTPTTTTTTTAPKAKAPKTPKTTYTPAAKPAPLPAASTKGCCARHGGVGQCNTSTGYLMCKDGTQSGSCKCS